MPPPKGRSFPFAPRNSADWLVSHVTYEQAVDMFFNQTATQQYLGNDPLIYSKVFRGITYTTIQEAQQVFSESMNSEYEAKEQKDLTNENRGCKASKVLNDNIRNRIVPTEDGLESLNAYRKPFGEKCISPLSLFTKSLDNQSIAHTQANNVPSIQNATQQSCDFTDVKPSELDWKPVQGDFPLLVFKSQKKMDDFDAPDMIYGKESREVIESYGFMLPFKNEMRYSPSMGYDIVTEDQFKLPASEHFKRMRSLGKYFSSSVIGRIMGFKTSHVFTEMVDKFERNEGGYFESKELTEAFKKHETTDKFHKEILKCLSNNLNESSLPKDILNIVIQYMNSKIKGEGAPLPQFLIKKDGRFHQDLFNGGVISVHGIWSMEVYMDSLEYKGSEIRGKFRYKVQDHFGLNTADINHDIGSLDKSFELIEGFRSWYLLQHFKEYGYKPFITLMDFDYE
ncbi:DUF3289 family protein [Aliivibrio fischeri]|uniref:DUF3289 family protein n=1 Tax=Aliivibrio fischeri TaxID=668 RepID=UPI001F2C00A9|nr:DUF3289 family protein [Aliivibrio fischeri]